MRWLETTGQACLADALRATGFPATCAEGTRPLYYGTTALSPQSGITTQQGVVSKHRTLSGGAIAGIVIGGVVFLILCAAAAYYIVRRHAAMKVEPGLHLQSQKLTFVYNFALPTQQAF